MALEITSKSLEGVAELVVCAPIKQGFIDAFENITYETRLRFATKAFYELRQAAREYELIKPFVDVAERIQSLLDFRIGILDTSPVRTLFLAATFDRAWEPYMRLIWNPLGTFLDVLFCNCEGYVTAGDHSFPEYADWVRANQVDSAIFYATTPLTVGDQLYLSKLERLQREGRVDDLALARMIADDPDVLAQAVRGEAVAPPRSPWVQQQFLTMASEALVVLYGLTPYYPVDRPQNDGKYLLRAAQDLLNGWDTKSREQLPLPIRAVHREAFDWLETKAPGPPDRAPDPDFALSEVQAGVLTGYDRGAALIKHGCLLLFSVTDPAEARRFIAGLLGAISWEAGPGPREDTGVFVNVAITKRGLVNLGVEDEVLADLPKEFREGMDDRAGLIGDIHANHPRRWALPQRFQHTVAALTPPTASDPDVRPPVELGEIDFIIQMRTASGDWEFVELPNDEAALRISSHPLAQIVVDMLDKLASATPPGVRLLCVEPMRRLKARANAPGQTRDHFGFADFVSQPSVTDCPPIPPPSAPRDGVARGELVLGYNNDRHDPPFIDGVSGSDLTHAFLRNGSFMVIRKLSQDVGALEEFLNSPPQPPGSQILSGDDLLAKMAGRQRDGTPLVAEGTAASNDFDFLRDTGGDPCPYQAHMRRANPRLSNFLVRDSRPVAPPFGRPTPRIMRRGMSYGPDFVPGELTAPPRRGVIFMAYCTSLAEQFEVIQRWINGGNSTGVAAAQNDPLMGVHPAEGGKTFRFAHRGEVVRVDIPKPFVGVEWGVYAFVPSRSALTKIATTPPQNPVLGSALRGEALLTKLSGLSGDQGRAAWKVYLEDFTAKDPAERADTPDIWAAIRDNHQGAIRIPAGVLVAGNDLVHQVLLDTEQRYSVSGQAERMRRSSGELYVGLDPGQRYDLESSVTNGAISSISRSTAFDIAFQAATGVLKTIFSVTAELSALGGVPFPVEIELRDDFITPTLALICNEFFGIPDVFDPNEHVDQPTKIPGKDFVDAGGWGWRSVAERRPRCPGDFMSPSRYSFYPDPTDAIAAYGIVQGTALLGTAHRYIAAVRAAATGGPKPPTGLLTTIMCANIADDDLVARNLIGIMVGALPPLDANIRFIFYDWIKEKTLWSHQQALLAHRVDPGGLSLQQWADKYLAPQIAPAMQKRPAPDLLWRTVVKAHRLGEADVAPGDIVIVSIVSATQERFNAGATDTGAARDVSAIFGGLRSAHPHPVHACPAYEMALGTMLGIITALFQAGQIEAMPGASLIKIIPS